MTSLVGLTFFSIFLPLARFVLILEVLFYLLALLVAGAILAGSQRKPLLLPGMVLAISTMHIFWGSGFLWSLLTTQFKFRNNG